MTFAHLTIETRDVSKTRDFFEQVMKWRVLQMPQNIDIDAAWLEIAEGQQLHILGIPDSTKPVDAEFGRHFALFHPADDFDGVIHRVNEHGGEVIEPIRETPFRRVFFSDPNGYVFELIDREGYVVES